jgi:hypothetical protein
MKLSREAMGKEGNFASIRVVIGRDESCPSMGFSSSTTMTRMGDGGLGRETIALSFCPLLSLCHPSLHPHF